MSSYPTLSSTTGQDKCLSDSRKCAQQCATKPGDISGCNLGCIKAFDQCQQTFGRGAGSSRESWYAMPGGEQYEGNLNVQVPYGPAWGPKHQRLVTHALSSHSKIGIGALVVVLVLLLLWFFWEKRGHGKPTGSWCYY